MNVFIRAMVRIFSFGERWNVPTLHFHLMKIFLLLYQCRRDQQDLKKKQLYLRPTKGISTPTITNRAFYRQSMFLHNLNNFTPL